MSLRLRLTLAFVGLTAAMLFVLDVALYFVVKQALINGIDNELRLGAQVLQQGFVEASREPRMRADDSDLPAFLDQSAALNSFTTTNLFVMVYDDAGNPIEQSPNLKRQPDFARLLLVDRDSVYASLEGAPQQFTMDVGVTRLRVLMVPLMYVNTVTNASQVAGVIQLVRPIGEIERAMQIFLYALAFGGVVVLIVAAQGGVVLTKMAFRPIDIIAQTAQSIVSAADLERRVPVPTAQDELQRLTLTINDLLDRLQELFNAQRRFLADASHELRTPLAAMKGNIEILQRGAVRDKELLDESLYDMRHETERLIRLVNDLLMLAKNEATEVMRRELVDLTSLLLEVVRELRPLAQQQRVELRLDIHDVVMLNGDRDRLKQALLNLCMNALQHTPAEGSVTCALVRSGEVVHVQIRDTGVGIAPEDLPHIFERFYRADRSRTRQSHVTSTGAGLGLAIVKYIVEAHGGSVTVESTVQVGTVFCIMLPCLPALSFDDE